MGAPALVFAVSVTLAAGLLFGLAPALQAGRLDLRGALVSLGGRASESRARRRLQSGLVVVQVALSLVLLVGAAAATRSLAELRRVDPGFEGDDVVTARWTLPEPGYEEPDTWRRFYRRLLDRVRELPGSISTAAINGLPLASSNDTLVYPEGRPPGRQADRVYAQLRNATPDYFATVSIPLLAGRDFDERDRKGTAAVAIVSLSLAERLFGTADAVGKRIVTDLGEPYAAEVIGVVGDVHNFSLASPADAGLYLAFAQHPGPRMSVVLRSALAPGAALQALRDVGTDLAPELPTSRDTTLAALVADSTATTRWQAVGVGGFAALAAALAALGLYGVLAQTVHRREREMGVRVALGATPAGVRRLVVGEGLALVSAGLFLGLPFAIATAVVAERHLFGVRAGDPAPFLAVAGLLLAVGWAASRIPAGRAMRVDPAEALRSE